MLWLRKILFYLFCGIYLILCPLLIARMLGFVSNPQTHQLVKTGLIYVSTNPPGAIVYIDDRKAHEPSPTVIRDLTPGHHSVRLQLNGYKTWEKKIAVVAKKASVLENILLIPQQWVIHQVSTKPYDNIITAAANYSILVGLNTNVNAIDIIRIDKDNDEALTASYGHDITPLFTEESIYTNARLVRYFSAAKSPFILLEVLIDDKRKFLWVDLKERTGRIEDISDLFPQVPDTIIWDDSDEKNIFAFYPQNIYRINVKAKAIYPQITPLPEAIRLQQSQPANTPPVFLINNKNYLLTREGQRVRIYPKDELGTPNIVDIVNTKPGTLMHFEEKTGELFYLDERRNLLNSVQILYHRPILTLPIAENLKIKKADK